MKSDSKLINKVTVHAKIIRADGTEEELGKIYEYDNTPLGRIKNKIRAMYIQVENKITCWLTRGRIL